MLLKSKQTNLMIYRLFNLDKNIINYYYLKIYYMTIVQSLWVGSNLSLMEVYSIKSFLKTGHEFHLYIYEPIQNIPKGKHFINLDLGHLNGMVTGSGMFLVRIRTQTEQAVKKCIILKN